MTPEQAAARSKLADELKKLGYPCPSQWELMFFADYQVPASLLDAMDTYFLSLISRAKESEKK